MIWALLTLWYSCRAGTALWHQFHERIPWIWGGGMILGCGNSSHLEFQIITLIVKIHPTGGTAMHSQQRNHSWWQTTLPDSSKMETPPFSSHWSHRRGIPTRYSSPLYNSRRSTGGYCRVLLWINTRTKALPPCGSRSKPFSRDIVKETAMRQPGN